MSREDQRWEHKEDTQLEWGGLRKLWTCQHIYYAAGHLTHCLQRKPDKASQLSHNAMKSAGSLSWKVIQRKPGYLEGGLASSGLVTDKYSRSWGRVCFQELKPWLPWDLEPDPSPCQVCPRARMQILMFSLSFQQSLWRSFQLPWSLTVQGKLRKGIMQQSIL